MINLTGLSRLSTVGLCFTILACGDDSTENLLDETQVPSVGEQLFTQRHTDGNTFACADCHAMSEPAADGIRRPGHSLQDAINRPSYKNGQLSNLLDAVNICRTEWMAATSWQATDERWLALEAHLASAAPTNSIGNIIESQIAAPPADLSGGDAEAGRTLFNQSCIVCHGQDGAGTNKGPEITGRNIQPDLIARRVRTSGQGNSQVYQDLTGGRMPFWAADRLSDQELLDIVAYVSTSSAATTQPTPDNNDNNNTDNNSNCGDDHPKVGQVAQLSMRQHDVGGTAVIVDNCTIRIDNFTFDDGGINVQIYGGQNGDYDRGPSLSGNLLRGQPYLGEELIVKLPDGVTLDDFDGISVWCVPIGLSFGDGIFEPSN